MDGASDDVGDGGGSKLLEAPVKIPPSSPLGDQLSSITRRIQLQREAERIQHRSVTRWQQGGGESAGVEGAVGGRLETQWEREMKLEMGASQGKQWNKAGRA